MPSKKREKEPEASKNQRLDQIQADHELFLQAFEKPTQIYRFLRTRNILSPVFLNRNLSYMRQRMSRSHKNRKGFHIDGVLERSMPKQRDNNQVEPMSGFVTLTFLGFYNKRIELAQDPVKVETLLVKICHKKRKDVSSPIMQVSVGTAEVAINPSEDHPPPKAPTLSIPTESFSLSNGHLVKSYMLLLRVHCQPGSGLCNGNNGDDEPPCKRRKQRSGGGEATEVKLYGAELVVYDKHKRCLLTDGDYELVVQEVQSNVKGSPKKVCSWETIGDFGGGGLGGAIIGRGGGGGGGGEGGGDGPFEAFRSGPTLKFRLRWTTEPASGLVDRPQPLFARQPVLDSPDKENKPVPSSATKNKSTPPPPPPREEKLRIVYQFLYNNNSRQQTEAREDLHCPWCSLNCVSLYSLLKHLKLCHSRFLFTYVPIPQGARIDVSINECYDGSYTGNPTDLISQPPGFAFSRNGPVRRTAVTNVLVCHPKLPKRPSLSEFLEVEGGDPDLDGLGRPYVTGHNRLYHHTVTCLPIFAKEMDQDSEGENDPEWLRAKTVMMIDEFTDVNEGEKELMKMWNLHVMKHGFVGDCQIPLSCQMFIEKHGRELLMKNLYRNFVLHMCNLFDFGLIGAATVYKTLQQLQSMIVSEPPTQRFLKQSLEKQRQCWPHVSRLPGVVGEVVANGAEEILNGSIAKGNEETKKGQGAES